MEANVDSKDKPQAAAPQRVQSTIDFPYLDLANAEEIAQGVHSVGGSSCDWDQLAAHFKQAAQGGGFRLRLITAKTFGLVSYDRGKVSLTALGLRMVDPQQQRSARIDAFLAVPLYKAVYDRFRGGTLPPNAGLESEMVALGVAPKQSDKARQAFQRSAKHAGFFEFGADRLVIPKNGVPPPSVDTKPQASVRDEAVVGVDSDATPPGRMRFEVPIPGKPSAVVMVPDDLDAEDWTMLSSMMTIYIERWKKFRRPVSASTSTGEG